MASSLLYYLDQTTLAWKRRGRTDVAAPILGSGGVTRPSGPGYQRFEDLYQSGDDLQHVLARVGAGNVLTLPASSFTLSDFKYGYVDGLRAGGSSLPLATGLVGSGLATQISMLPGSSTKASLIPTVAGTTNPAFMINFNNCTNVELGNFTVIGTDQGHYYNGFMVSNGSGGSLHDALLQGVNPGYLNAPPGETFAVDVYKQNSFTIINTEIDGRRPDGTRVGASNIGFNNLTGAYLTNVYTHHTYVGHGATCYSVAGPVVYANVRTEYNGHTNPPGQTGNTGAGFNFERTSGTINLVSCTWLANTGVHVILDNDQDYATLNIYDPVFDGAQLIVKVHTTYAGNPNLQRSHLGLINIWVGGSYDAATAIYTGGTLRNDLLNITT